MCNNESCRNKIKQLKTENSKLRSDLKLARRDYNLLSRLYNKLLIYVKKVNNGNEISK